MGVGHRIDWFYGATYVGHDYPLSLDLSRESSLRFSFADAPEGLNFNVLLYFRNELDNYSQIGVNIPRHDAPFAVDLSLAEFAARPARPKRGADLSRVSGIYIVTQSGAVTRFGGAGFRLTSISAVPEPESAALLALGLLALAGRRAQRAGHPA